MGQGKAGGEVGRMEVMGMRERGRMERQGGRFGEGRVLVEAVRMECCPGEMNGSSWSTRRPLLYAHLALPRSLALSLPGFLAPLLLSIVPARVRSRVTRLGQGGTLTPRKMLPQEVHGALVEKAAVSCAPRDRCGGAGAGAGAGAGGTRVG